MDIDKLTILWTSDNEDVAVNMLLMYSIRSNSAKWWNEFNLITWGPSNKLLCQNPEVQIMVKQVLELGGNVYACRKCAEGYGVVDQLESMGIQVVFMGEPFTKFLKDSTNRVITI